MTDWRTCRVCNGRALNFRSGVCSGCCRSIESAVTLDLSEFWRERVRRWEPVRCECGRTRDRIDTPYCPACRANRNKAQRHAIPEPTLAELDALIAERSKRLPAWWERSFTQPRKGRKKLANRQS